MPGKSRHRKDKHLSHNKIKAGPGHSATIASPPVPAQTKEPLVLPKAAVASANVPMPTAKLSATPRLNISRELRTIVLLAGIVLVILIIVMFIAR